MENVNHECINPTEIEEDDLMAYVDGTADRAVVRHVRRCPACARQAGELAALQAVLRAQIYRCGCPPPEQLLAYRHGELDGGKALQVAQHLRQCPHCAHEMALLARQAREGLGSRLRSALRTIEATLITPQLQAQAVPLRGQTPPTQIFRTSKFDILLSQHPARARPEQWDLSGLIHSGGRVPSTIDRVHAELYRGKGLIALTQVGKRGQFSFAALDPGRYDLELVWPEQIIRLAEVQVG